MNMSLAKKKQKSLAVAVYNHYKRIQQLGPSEDDVELQKVISH